MRTTYSLSFYCRDSKAGKNGLAPIELSIVINGKRVFINMPRKEYPSEFKKAITSKRNNQIKEYLEAIRNQFYNIQMDMLKNNIPLSAETLREYYRCGGVKPYTIQNLFDDFLKLNKKRIGTDLTEPAYQKYEYVRNLFFQQVNPEAEVSSITCSTIDAFYVFLQGKYNPATSASHMTRLKTIITYAMDDGKLQINPFKNLKIRHYRKKIEYLSEEELNRLYGLEIDNKSLDDVRDAFVLQASTGLAYIDILNLRKEDIKITEDGTHYITKTRHKTNSEYTTVVLPLGVEILKKHNYNLHIISNQKYNLFLKTLQALAGIQTNLTTHIARKTFCCLLLNKGVSINTVAKCAGHQDIKITRQYYATLQEETVIKEIKAVF